MAVTSDAHSSELFRVFDAVLRWLDRHILLGRLRIRFLWESHTTNWPGRYTVGDQYGEVVGQTDGTTSKKGAVEQ